MEKMPVLNRPMFNAPSPSMGGGISTVPRPEIEAQNLRNLFAPAQPVQSFQEGGSVQAVDSAEAEAKPPVTSQFRRDIESLLPSLPTEETVRKNSSDLARLTEDRAKAFAKIQAAREEYSANSPGSTAGDYFRSLSPEDLRARAEARATAEKVLLSKGEGIGSIYGAGTPPPPPRSVAPGPSISPEDVARMRDRDIAEESSTYAARQGQAAQALAQRAPPPPPPPEPIKPKGELELSLEAIRSRRAEDRKENALLALMQAGFATAGGRSSSALTNIAAGGQAGIAAFAGMEKGSREDQRAAMQDLAMRRREISSEKLARDLATQKMEQDPDQIRTYAILGGWVPGQSKEAYQQAVTKGYSATQAKEAPKLATAILTNPLITQNYTPEELKTLADVARRGVVGMSSSGYTGFRDVTPR